MLFNSVNFALFLPIVFLLYWFVTKKSLKAQNILLLVSSYFFYACWDWRFLFLLMFSTLLDYYTGIMMSRTDSTATKKIWFWLSIIINLGFLGVFKYYNFFVSSFAEAAEGLGFTTNPVLLEILLPVGISFYTFHGLSYVIDIYKERIEPEKNFVDYAVFVSFFPLLVAGPIERATHLLPQIKAPRIFNLEKAKDGLRQILWGLVKKIIIADQCAELANNIFNNSDELSGSSLVLGAIFFTFQIYGDFSGYSDIALGTARLFGIELLRNFSYPYFSRDIAEFWRRWHISLSSWFRDYLYIPLGGSRGGMWMKIRNTFIIFLVSGFWHGANWTFIVWGGLHALYFLPLLVSSSNRQNMEIVAQGRMLPTLREAYGMITTFALVAFAWIFFRAENITHAFKYIGGIFSASLFEKAEFANDGAAARFLLLAFLMLVVEWIARENKHGLETLALKWKRPFRWALYYALVIAIMAYGGKDQQFIYFQF